MKTDVVIVGGGPGGATAALCLAAEGLDVAIVEKESFPRFHIGESMTGECGALVRRLGLEAEMERMKNPVKNATDVYGTSGANKFRVPVMSRTDQATLEPSTTWQVRRSEFDAMLIRAARQRGVTVLDGQVTEPILDDNGSVIGVMVEQDDGEMLEMSASMTVDASGRSAWASRAGLTGPRGRGHYAAQTAVSSHLKGAVRDPGADSGNTIIFYADRLHWAWFIPIDDEITSVGVVAPNTYLKQHEGALEEYFQKELETLNPELTRRVTDVVLTEPVQSTANFSYEISDYVGPGFVAIGDAHRFIDPIFSFGLYVAMAEAEHAAGAIVRHLRGEGDEVFEDHVAFAERGQNALQTLVDGFWANPLAFGYMVHQSSYSEELVDIFAGRIYGEAKSPALEKLEAVIAKANSNPGSG